MSNRPVGGKIYLPPLMVAYSNQINSLTLEELDRSFVFYTWQAEAQPETMTLRQRVLQTAADHLREHQAHLAETLARWRAAV